MAGALELLALVSGAKEGNSMMTKNIDYISGKLGKLTRIDDFLPKPADLVLRNDKVKVTLSLSRHSLDFFKREAKKQHVPYQRMIRALVDRYAEESSR